MRRNENAEECGTRVHPTMALTSLLATLLDLHPIVLSTPHRLLLISRTILTRCSHSASQIEPEAPPISAQLPSDRSPPAPAMSLLANVLGFSAFGFGARCFQLGLQKRNMFEGGWGVGRGVWDVIEAKGGLGEQRGGRRCESRRGGRVRERVKVKARANARDS